MRTTALFVFLCFSAFPVKNVFGETVEQIVQLAEKGLGEEVLIAAVERSKEGFRLTTNQIVDLKKAGLPDSVIAAMLRKKADRPNDAISAIPPATIQPKAVVQEDALKIETVAAHGILNLENVDDRNWAYRADRETKLLWILPGQGESQLLSAHQGISLSLPIGNYEVRYAGEKTGFPFEIRKDSKTLLLLSRIDSEEFEGLYVSIFEKGERKNGGRLALLRNYQKGGLPQANFRYTPAKTDPEPEPKGTVKERVIERTQVIEAPTTTVVYRTPAPVYVYHPYWVYPYYYPPVVVYPRPVPCPPYGVIGFGYSKYGRRSGWSVGLGVGF